MTLSAREQQARAKATLPPEFAARQGNPLAGLAGLSADAMAAVGRPADPPDRVVRLAPTAWSEKWPDRPAVPVDVGIARIGEGHQMQARADAAQTADRMHPEMSHDSPVWITTYNQAVMLGCIAAALTKPNNRHEPLWPQQAEILPKRITTAGAERLFDELELVTVIEGPTRPEATDQQLFELGEDLTTGAFWLDMPVTRARHIRRLLAFAIELAEEPILALTTDHPNDV